MRVTLVVVAIALAVCSEERVLPGDVAYTGSVWMSAALFWVIKERIKMTGMPAWKYRMDDDDIWRRSFPQAPPAPFARRVPYDDVGRFGT